MKRRVLLFGIFFVFLIFFLSNISAELNSTHINQGYSCLQNKTANCSTSLDDNIFTLLALKSCKSQVLQASTNDECWPSGSCKIKQTAQALLALKESGSDTSKPKNWLLSHNKTTTNIDWFLQIESAEATTCSITYSGRSYPISIGEDKKINANAGPCLSLAQDNYWFQFSPSAQCQSYQYQISCNKDFQTSTLFKEQSSETIYVIGREINSASSGGTTTEQVNSSCFADGNVCSYEGTLWASLVLNSLDYDVSSYIPYLVVTADSYPRTLPEAFLYILLGDTYRNDLLLKQKSSKYWEASGDRYYDTAMALLALRSDDVSEKTNSLNWLEDTQGSDGCWQGSIKNTAFLLYSIAPGATPGGGGTTSKPDCETAGYFCSSATDCRGAGGNVLDNYQCSSGLLKCCDKEKQVQTCAEQGGEVCSNNEQCVGGVEAEASDISSYETCCVGGSCVAGTGGTGGTENECEISFGTCRTFECSSGEQINSSLSCDSSSQVCCIQTKEPPSSSYLWIWILVIFIILLIIAIIFRDKLRRFWIYIKTKFKPRPGSPEAGARSPGPPYFGAPMRRMIPRRILPQTAPQSHRPVPPRRPSGELDEVLKKLKDMSK